MTATTSGAAVPGRVVPAERGIAPVRTGRTAKTTELLQLCGKLGDKGRALSFFLPEDSERALPARGF